MEKKVQTNPIHVCPECQGAGLVNSEKCKECQGVGEALVIDKKIYYWGKKMSYLGIMEKRYERKVRIVINSLFYIFGFLGFLSLLRVLYDLQLAGLELYKFIDSQNEYALVWWISLMVDMYLVYRISRESKLSGGIDKKPRLALGKSGSEVEFDWGAVKKYKRIDVSRSFDQASLATLEDAWLLAHKLGHSDLANIHLFTTLLSETQTNMVFARLGVNYRELAGKVKRSLEQVVETGRTALGAEIKQVLLVAYLRAYDQRKDRVATTDLLFASAYREGMVKDILYEMNMGQREIAHVVEWVDLQRWLIRKWHELKYRAKFKPKNVMNRTFTAIATPNLDQISRDMTLFARAGGYEPWIGREKEVAEIFRVLEVDKLGAVLVGPSGVGKNTIVEGIAQLMVKEEVPKILEDKRLVSLSVSGLIAGASRMGEMENRIITLMGEVGRSKNIVLFIEDIHHMVGVSAESGESMDVAEVLAEQMQKNNFLVLATTTPEFYRKHLERSSLAKTLQKVMVNEMDEDEAIRVLEAKTLRLEGKNHIYFSYQSLASAVKLAKQYLHDEYLPEKAIRMLEEVALRVKEERGEKAIVNSEDIAGVISTMTNIPVKKITADETKKLLNLEERIHEKVIGQDEAVKLVAAALRRARTELRGKDRPIASFLFLGPTGVGKTQIAKTLAGVYFGSEKNMIRVDMSEYQASDALAKLIGDARINSGGYLTEAVRKSPFSLVLLDEVEKATPDILNVFLQVLDDGRLTDAAGKTIDFTNTIIIGTSNAGTELIQEGIKRGDELEKIRQFLINQELKDYFRPELLNRFDGIVVFHPLVMEQVVEIAKLFLGQLAVQLEEKGVEFEVTEEAVRELATLGFDPTLGARPLRRVIQDKVEDQLARLFLEKKVDRRDKVILKQGLVLEVAKAKEI